MRRATAIAVLVGSAAWAGQAQTQPARAVIAGQVLDEFGDPVIAARVVAESVAASGAPSRLLAAVSTDDRGDYRLPGIPTGACTVAVMRPAGTVIFTGHGPAFSPPIAGPGEPEKTYYPGRASAADAEVLRLAAGEERGRIDFVLPARPAALPPIAAMRLLQAGSATPRDPNATASIGGRVATTDGRAIAHAQVQLVPNVDLAQSRAMLADADGRFAFRDVAAGTFLVVASKPGFSAVDAENPFAPAGGTSRVVDLAGGDARGGVDLTLARWSALSGTVVDEAGAPIPGASVQLLAIGYSAGRRRLVPAWQAANNTDDLGRYRVYGVPPGRYVISAAVGGASTADLPGYARGYYPGTSEPANAQFVPVGLSQELTGLDVPLARTRTARVTGQVRNAAGQPANPGSLMLVPSARSASIAGVPIGARLSTDGSFEFPNVPPGQYVIRADRGRNNATEGEFGTLPVTVNGADVTGVVVRTSTGSNITGRFRFEAFHDTKLPAPRMIELRPMPVDYDQAPSSVATAEIHPDWTFELHGINGPRRLQLLRVPAGWALEDIRARGADVTDRPLAFGSAAHSLSDVEIVLTDRVSEIGGAIVDDRGRPVPAAHVIVFSTDRDRWYAASRFMRHAVADSGGAFAIAPLPFGSYHIAALARLPLSGDDEWQDPAFLESLIARASRISVSEAQTQTVSLRVSPQ